MLRAPYLTHLSAESYAAQQQLLSCSKLVL
jgi:hypothetical protein